MHQRIVNLFAYGDSDIIGSIGWQEYTAEGTYHELLAYLQDRATNDYKTANAIPLAKEELRSALEFAIRISALHQLTPEVARIVGDSIFCISHIVNGEYQEGEVYHAPPNDLVPDYLTMYSTDSGLDFGEMINDDFMDAMKILWNNKKYISALKLLVIMIDTLGFVEFGPKNNCLEMWLDKYCDLSPLGVSSAELWELRNSLIHMTNLDSRRVQGGQVKRLIPMIADPHTEIPVEGDDFKCLHLSRLFLYVIPNGVVNWVQELCSSRDRFLDFVRRYDTVVSDTRVSVADVTES